MKMEQLTGAFHLDAPGARQRKRSVWWILAYGENCYEKSFLEPLTDEKKCYRAKRYMSCTLIFPGAKESIRENSLKKQDKETIIWRWNN